MVVTLPDTLDAHVQHWAALTHREGPRLLPEALALVLTPIGAPWRCPAGHHAVGDRGACPRAGADGSPARPSA